MRGGTGGTSSGGRSTGIAARDVTHADASSIAASRQATRLFM
jgi:hypothetical protein